MASKINERYVEVAISPPPNVMSQLMDELAGYVNSNFDARFHDCYELMMQESQKKYVKTSRGIRVPSVAIYNLPNLGSLYHTGKYVAGKWVNGISIELEIEGGTKTKSDNCIVKLYNARTFIGKNSICVVSAGYLSNFGTVFIGRVNSVEREVSGQDIITILRLTEASQMFLKGQVTDMWTNQKFTDVIRDIVIRYGGLTIGYIHEYLPPGADASLSVDDYTIEQQYWYNRSRGTFIITKQHSIGYWVYRLIQQMNSMLNLKDSNAYHYQLIQGRFYMMPKNIALPMGLYFESKSGLLSVEATLDNDGKNKEGKYKIITMFDCRICNSSIIKVLRSGKTEAEYFKVSKFKFVSNDTDHQIEMECKMIKDAHDRWINFGVPVEVETIDDIFDEEEPISDDE